ncbi:MAG TPA: cobyric acid synthase [Bryobacteraceae bacterium]|nr:cobyric acid synthase [Bryobacteraceae bacterium]
MSTAALMILGTASHVGKSILTAALGRILADEGHRVAPFKAQNMSLNSAATPDGREIGRAQALQAEACRVAPRAEMNPVLIKPSNDSSAQVVVLGRVWGEVSALDYHQRRVEELFPLVLQAYRTLAAEHDVVLLEGAGSPAEINLKAHDIVNMRMAQAAGAACLLVGDIDRGGVFASLLGTVELLDAAERALLRGFVVNKFRGDVRLLQPGIDMIEQRIQLPCGGIVPYLPDLGLDEEDSVALEETRRAPSAWKPRDHSSERPLRVGVVKFPYLANFTDFDALAAEPSVSLALLNNPEELPEADLLILPGSKQTLDDLRWLRCSGFAAAIQKFAGRVGVMGICGGMQMMGASIEDPQGAENKGVPRADPGLALLPIDTVLHAEKVTRMARGRVRTASLFGEPLAVPGFQGYEIHLGETAYAAGAQPFAEIQRCGETTCRPDGVVSAGRRAFGTYIHGLFNDDGFRHSFLSAARAACGLDPLEEKVFVHAEREQRIDRLAHHVRRALDMDLIHACLGVKS